MFPDLPLSFPMGGMDIAFYVVAFVIFEFIALAQVMVYVGGVVIFVVFTILLTSHLGEDAFSTKVPRLFTAFALSIAFVFVMIKCILPTSDLANGIVHSPADYSSLENFALRLLGYDQSGFIIPFEVVSVLLLMTLICAITVARRSKEEVEEEKEASK